MHPFYCGYKAAQERQACKACSTKMVHSRRTSATNTHSVLYVDNPAGTGFSYTGDDSGYSTDQTAVARNLYAALLQIFKLFPEYRLNNFYMTGESFAGHHVPAVSTRTTPEQRSRSTSKGWRIGNGLVDPLNQLF